MKETTATRGLTDAHVRTALEGVQCLSCTCKYIFAYVGLGRPNKIPYIPFHYPQKYMQAGGLLSIIHYRIFKIL